MEEYEEKSKVVDNYSCISVSPNGQNVVVIDPDATAIKIYSISTCGTARPVEDEISLPQNFAASLVAKGGHISLAVADDHTIALSVFNISPDTLPKKALIEVNIRKDGIFDLDSLGVGSTRIVDAATNTIIVDLDIGGVIRFIDNETVVVLQETTYTLCNIYKQQKRQLFMYPPPMMQKLSVKEAYKQNLLLDRQIIDRFLISIDPSGGLDLFDVTNGELVQNFRHAPINDIEAVMVALIPFVTISSNSKFLAACDKKGQISVYLMESGIHVATLRSEKRDIDMLCSEKYGHPVFMAFIDNDQKLFTIIENKHGYRHTIYELSEFYTNTEYHSFSRFSKKDFGFRVSKHHPIIQTVGGLFYVEADGKPTKLDPINMVADETPCNSPLLASLVINSNESRELLSIPERPLPMSEKKYGLLPDAINFEPWERTGRPHRSEALDSSRSLWLIVGEDTIQIWQNLNKPIFLWAAHDHISDLQSNIVKIKHHTHRREGEHDLIIKVATDDEKEDTVIRIYNLFKDGNHLRQSVVPLVNSFAFIKRIQQQTPNTSAYIRNSKRIRDLESCARRAIYNVIENQPDVWQLMDSRYKIMRTLLLTKDDDIIAEILKPGRCLHRPQFYGDGYQYYESDLTVASGISRESLRKMLRHYSKNALEAVGWMATFSSALPLLYRKHQDIVDEYFSNSAVFGAKTVDPSDFQYCDVSVSPERLSRVRSIDFIPKLQPPPELDDDSLTFTQKTRHNVLKSIYFFARLFKSMYTVLPSEQRHRFGTLCLVPLPEFDGNTNAARKSARPEKPTFWSETAERLSRLSKPSFLLWIPAVNLLYMVSMRRSIECACSPFLNLFKLLPSSSIFESPCMEAVVDFKWRKYGQNKFTQYLVYYCVCFIMFSALIWHWLNAERSKLMTFYALIMVFNYVFFLLFALKKLRVNPRSTYAWIELLTIIAAVGANILMLLDSVGVLANGAQTIVIYSAFAILSLWVQFILMLRVVNGIGHYVSTPISILKHTYRFLVVMALFIIGYGHTIFVLLSNPANDSTAASSNNSSDNMISSMVSKLRGGGGGGSSDSGSSNNSSSNSSSSGDSTFNNIANSVVQVFFWTSGTSPLVQNQNFLTLTVILVIGTLILVTMMQNILIALMTAVVETVKEDEKNMILVLRAEYLIVVEEMLLSSKEHHNREWFPKHIFYYANADLVEKWYKKERATKTMHGVEERISKLESLAQGILDALNNRL